MENKGRPSCLTTEFPSAEWPFAGSENETRCERLASSRWGQYLTAVEKEAILCAHALVPTASTSIEIGCEGGRWSSLLADLGWLPTCVDIDPKTLAVCQRRLPQARCILTSPQARRLPAADNSMGLVLIIEVPAVIESTWFPTEANRVLRKDGLLVGVCWNRASLRGLVSRVLGRQKKSLQRGKCYSQTYESVKGRIQTAGFSFLFERGFCWSPFSRASDSSLIPACVTMERILKLRDLIRWSPWVIFIARKGA